MKLQGAKLAAVVAEVLTEQEAAERERQKREVKQIITVIQSDMKRARQNQQDHLEAAATATERMKALQDRLKKIKAGDQGALKTPESVGNPVVAYDIEMPRWFRNYEQSEARLLQPLIYGGGRSFRGF